MWQPKIRRSLAAIVVLLLVLACTVARVRVQADAQQASGQPTLYLPFVARSVVFCGSKSPKLLAPANGATLDTLVPLFQWDCGAGESTGVHLVVWGYPNSTWFTDSLGDSRRYGVAGFRFIRNFAAGTTYYWRARFRCYGADGPYSETWSFTAGTQGTILPAPTLISPPDDSVVASGPVTLRWSAVEGAVEYLVSQRPVGAGYFGSGWVTEPQFSTYRLANTAYEWWVSARNEYAIGEPSETWQFTTPAAPARGTGCAPHWRFHGRNRV